MHQKTLMIPVLLLAFAGLMNEALPAEPDISANTANIRVYQEGDITLYPGDICYGANNPAAIHAAASGFGIFNTHKRVGMPVTDDIPGAYNEYVIPAGLPMSVMLQGDGEKDGIKLHCGPTGAKFFPQAGRNYDVSMGYTGICSVQIRELFEISPGKAVTSRTPASPTFACPTK
jgi:hypothetical protein